MIYFKKERRVNSILFIKKGGINSPLFFVYIKTDYYLAHHSLVDCKSAP